MYKLEVPVEKIGDFFEDLLEGRQDNLKNSYRKTRLLAIKDKLIEAEDNYINLAQQKKFHSFLKNDEISISKTLNIPINIPRKVNATEMEKVYTSYFVGKSDSGKIGRKIYEGILKSADYSLCPYCSHRDVNTVDHYFPKSKFISYAVTPVNLIPSCTDCNKNKLDTFELFIDRTFIHPYFENLEDEDWLDCEVVIGKWPITFSYTINSEIENPVLKSRLKNQFSLLELSELYSDNATREFRKRAKSIIKEYESNPNNDINYFLDDNIESYREESNNSWQTKMYEALRKSEWFNNEALPLLKFNYPSSKR